MLEKISLVNAIGLLAFLIYLHLRHVNPASNLNCLSESMDHMGLKIQDFDILRIHVTSNDFEFRQNNTSLKRELRILNSASENKSEIVTNSYFFNPDEVKGGIGYLWKYLRYFNVNNNSLCSISTDPLPIYQHQITRNSIEISHKENKKDIQFLSKNISNTSSLLFSLIHSSFFNNNSSTSFILETILPDRIYLYSQEKGYLMLKSDTRDNLNLTNIHITILKSSSCFGSGIPTWVVHNIIGYDTLIMNWIISYIGGRGYLYNVQNREIFNLNLVSDSIKNRTKGITGAIAYKIGIVFTTVFLFFTTTTLVSFTLRETQERMLKFTYLLQYYIRHRLPYAPLVLTHVVESLVFVPIMVGILFFLFEFFSDQLLAFMVLSLVWMGEVFSVVSVRTLPSIRFFPRAFFLYFALFHIYFFSFPFGFSYVALFTTVMFLQHAMLHCLNRYELPALESGQVNAHRPRLTSGIIGWIQPGETSNNTSTSEILGSVTGYPSSLAMTLTAHVELSRQIQRSQLAAMMTPNSAVQGVGVNTMTIPTVPTSTPGTAPPPTNGALGNAAASAGHGSPLPSYNRGGNSTVPEGSPTRSRVSSSIHSSSPPRPSNAASVPINPSINQSVASSAWSTFWSGVPSAGSPPSSPYRANVGGSTTSRSPIEVLNGRKDRLDLDIIRNKSTSRRSLFEDDKGRSVYYHQSKVDSDSKVLSRHTNDLTRDQYKNEFLDRTSIHEFGSSTSSDDHLIVKSGLQERCNSAGAGDIVWPRTSGSRGCEGSRSSSYPTPMLKAHLPGNSKGASNVNVNGIGSKDDSNTLLDSSFTVFGSDLQDDDAELL